MVEGLLRGIRQIQSVGKYEGRWYKGKYFVLILQKSKGNYLVEAIDECKAGNKECGYRQIPQGERFTTVPRLLNRKPRISVEAKTVQEKTK